MTKEELKKYNGEKGNSAYIACDGKIYDVTNFRQWKGGVHAKRFHAGEDLTQYFSFAPHGKRILSRCKIVGELTD